MVITLTDDYHSVTKAKQQLTGIMDDFSSNWHWHSDCKWLMNFVNLLTEVIGNFSNWMLMVSLIGTFGSLFALMWKRQETPTNYILLAVFVRLSFYITSLNLSCVCSWDSLVNGRSSEYVFVLFPGCFPWMSGYLCFTHIPNPSLAFLYLSSKLCCIGYAVEGELFISVPLLTQLPL